MAFDFEGAMAAGYSVGDINDFLSKKYNFDVSGARKAGYSDDEILEKLVTYEPPPPPEPEDAGVMGRLGDAAIDLIGKGTVGAGEALVGVGDLLTGNLLGKGLGAMGYDPKATREFLDTLYTEERQAEQKKVQAAEGFLPTLKAMLEEPATILGVGLESAPQMIGGAGAVRKAATSLISKAGITAEQLLTEAGKKAAQEVLKQNAGKLAAIGGAAEGAMAAGSIQEQARQEGRDWSESAGYAALGGLGTAAIGAIGGRLLPTAETALGTSGLTGATGRLSRAAATSAGEGVQETLQSAQEQAMTNLSLGRPWDEGIGQAAAMGLLAGAGMGATTGAMTGGQSAEAEQVAPPSAEEDKQERVRELTVDLAEYQRNLEDAVFSEQAINEQLAMPDITQEQRGELEQRLADIGENKAQINDTIAQFSTELESLTQTTQAPPAALNPVAPPPAAAEPTPTPPPNFANPELQAYVERMLLDDPLTLLNQMGGDRGFESLLTKQEANEIAVLKRNEDELYEQAEVAESELERSFLLGQAEKAFNIYEERTLDIARTAARRNLYGSAQQAGDTGSGASPQVSLFAGVPGVGGAQGTQQQGVGSSVGSAGQTAGGAGQSDGTLSVAERQQQAAGNFKTFGAILPGGGLDLQGGQAPRRPSTPPPAEVEQDFGPPQTQEQLKFQRGEPQGKILRDNTGATVAQDKEGEQNFRTFYGNSAVVTEKQEPIRLFTGTSKDVDFSKFKMPKNGVWFTPDPAEASQYAMENDSRNLKYNRETRTFDDVNTASRVLPVYVRIENPKVYDAKEFNDLLYKYGKENYKKAQGIIFDRLRFDGYDGVRIRSSEDPSQDIWVAIQDKNQIKSALGNSGAYSLKNDDIRYQQTGMDVPAAPRLTETQTRAYVNQLTKNWKNAPKITVVQSIKDLPDDLRGRVLDDAKGFILGDKVYVVADNAPDLNSVTGTVFHESLGHYGLKQQFQTRLDSLLKGVYDTNTAMRKATDDWRTRNADTYASLPEDQQLIRAVEEVMAEVSEAGQVKNAGLRAAINKFVAFIRDYARRMGFEVDFSNNDVAQILRQAHERVVGKGTTAGLDTEIVKPMFLGAQNANPEARANYSVATEMEKEGEPMEAIRLTTGWARNKNDNKWRYEVTDKNAKLKLPVDEWPDGATIKDVFDHPALFQAYPDIKDIPVKKIPGKGGQLSTYPLYKGQIKVDYLGVGTSSLEPASVILHELQHYIQDAEGYARGGTSAKAKDYLLANDVQIPLYYDEIVEALNARKYFGDKPATQVLGDITTDKKQVFFSSTPEGVKLRTKAVKLATKSPIFSHSVYTNLAGEIEARETQSRQKLSEYERKTNTPKSLYGAKDKKALVMYQRSGLPPVALQEFIRYQRVMGQVDPARPDRTSIGKLRDALYGTKSRTAREIFIKASSLDMMRQLFETRNRPLAHAIRMLEKAMGRKDSSVMRGREEIEKNLRRWQGVLKDAQPQVVDKWQAIIRDSTMLQIDVEAAPSRTLVQQVDNGTRTRASLTPEEDNVYALTKQFLALPSPMRQMYSELRQAYKGYYTRYFNAIAAMSPSVAAKIKQDFMANMMSVYFPLTRNGDFWVSYQDANNDTWVEAFESESERNDFVKTLNSTAGVTAVNPYSKLGTADFHKSAPNSGFLADVMEKLRGANIPVQLQNQILEDYLNHLPSKSLLQQFNKRKRGPTGQLASPLGAKIDPMQAYATVASRFNNNIAVLRYTPDMETALKDAEGAFKGGNQADDLAAVTVDALKSQVATSMTPRYGVLDKAGTGVYYMTMAANVSSAFMNLFSLPMISMSVLAGKYGLGKTTKLFFGPNGVMRTMFTGGFDTNTDVMPDYTAFASGNASNPEMQRLYKELIARSVIRRSTGFDIRDVESSDVRDYTGTWAKGKRFMGYMMHNTERFTREATAIAAYKLARDAGKSQRDAIESAIDTVHETHGTGTTETGPQLFQHGVGRMAYILKRYAHTMLWLQYKLFKNAMKGADPATRKEARRQLLYVFGTTFAVAGVRGLPTVGGVLLLTSILNGMFGDDDEPFDVEAEFDQIFGKYGKGAINAITGIEVASRTSLTDLLIRSDERRLAEVGPMLYTIEKVFGPVISIGANIERGVGQMSEGHYARGVESMAPAAARNILKGYRYYKDEARTVDGTKLIADVSKYNAFMQMAGFSDTDVMRANERARIDVKTAKFLTDRKKALYDKFFLAVFNKDEEGRKEVLEEIRAFNRKNPLVAINAAGLRSSVKNKIVGVYQSMDGVYQPPKTRLAGSKYYDFSAEREAEEEDYEEEDYDEGSYEEDYEG